MLVNEQGQTLEEFLAQYDPKQYEHPSVTVDMAVFTEQSGKLSVLLIRRKNHPFIGTRALPGGFVNMDESLEEAAARELEEETGVQAYELHQLGAYGLVDRDPRTRIITVAYLAYLPEGMQPKAADDAADARLFAVEVQRSKTDAVGTYAFTLRNGETVLQLRAELERDGRGNPKIRRAEGDLAGDHSLILFDAIVKWHAYYGDKEF